MERIGLYHAGEDSLCNKTLMKSLLSFVIFMGLITALSAQSNLPLQKMVRFLPDSIASFHRWGETHYQLATDSSEQAVMYYMDQEGNMLQLDFYDYDERTSRLNDITNSFDEFYGSSQINFATLDAFEGRMYEDSGKLDGEILIKERFYLHLSIEEVQLDKLRQFVKALPLYEMSEGI